MQLWGPERISYHKLRHLSRYLKECLGKVIKFIPKGIIVLGNARYGHTRGDCSPAMYVRVIDSGRLRIFPPRHKRKSE